MQKFLILIFTIMVVFINGCDSIIDSNADLIVGENPVEYFPFAVNASWTRTSIIDDIVNGQSIVTYTDSIVAKTLVDNKIYYSCKYKNDEMCLIRFEGDICYYRYDVENDGNLIQKAAATAVSFSEDLPLFLFGVKTNTIWTIETGNRTDENGPFSWITTGEFLGVEDVGIAGEANFFTDCAKFSTTKITTREGADTITEIWTLWFSRNVGLVEENYEKIVNGVVVIGTSTSLVGHTIPEPPYFYFITGQILDESGMGISDVKATLTSDSTSTVIDAYSAEEGFYHFTDIPEGPYTIKITKMNHIFSPDSLIVNILDIDVTGQNFVATVIPSTYFLSGSITDTANNGIQNVLLTLKADSAYTTLSSGNGEYIFTDLSDSTCIITPAKEGYTFEPDSLFVLYEGLDIEDINFTGTLIPQTYRISGTITDSNGEGMAEVLITLSGESTYTSSSSANGRYTFTDIPEGSYSIIPSYENHTFKPGILNIIVEGQDQTGQNFTAVLDSYTISGTVTGAEGVTVTLSGDASDNTAVNDGSRYSFNVLQGGSYTVTPAKEGYTFSPSNAAFSDVASDVSQNFTAVRDAYTISGTVTGADGVTVTLSGDASDNITVNDGGRYSFNVLQGGSYTVTPAKEGYTFSPSNAAFSDVASDVSQNFTAVRDAYTISGTVTGADGVTVTLSGDASDNITVNDGGRYSFNVLQGGSYTVTPAKDGFTFSPSNAAFSDVASDVSQNFTAVQDSYTISGTVTGTDGVTVTLSGDASDNTAVNDGGRYSFNVLGGGSYTVTPSKMGYTFSPSNKAFSDVASDMSQNFTAVRDTYTISGTVTGADGVTVTLRGDDYDNITVNDGGNYTFTVHGGGSYSVTPSKKGYTFSPSNTAFSDVASDMSQNFTGVQNSYTISGTVTGADGVTVTLSGDASESRSIDQVGRYSFTVLGVGSYTVTPAKTGYTFSPSNKAFSDVDSDMSQNFTAVQDLYTISGTVTGADGAIVTLSGDASGSISIDEVGNYSFTVQGGGDFTVTPSKEGYAFSPQSADIHEVDSDVAQDFDGAQTLFVISGTVDNSFTESGEEGVEITLSNSVGLKLSKAAEIQEDLYAMTDENGYYEFIDIPMGEYTVTPAKSGYSFSPPEDYVSVESADQTGIDFTGTPPTFFISGFITYLEEPIDNIVVEIYWESTRHTDSVTTDEEGMYIFEEVLVGDYVITPVDPDYVFTPEYAEISICEGDYENVGFIAELSYYEVSGNVEGDEGVNIGVTITLTKILGEVALKIAGAQEQWTTLTDENGDYVFENVQDGEYTITPSKGCYMFDPDERPITVEGEDMTDNDFLIGFF